MAKIIETPREIDYLTRLASSAMGNPRYRVHFTDGSSALSQSDASWCYGADAMVGVPVLVSFTRSGRVATVRRAHEA